MEVLYPNTVYFKDGKNADYYIDLAGGTTSTAKKSKTIIIYMNGMVARADRKHKPRPGCQIVKVLTLRITNVVVSACRSG